MSVVILRHLEMLKVIPNSAPGISTSDIGKALEAQGFTISRRSIQRDLEKLSHTFPLTCEADGKSNRWYFVLNKGQRILIPGMDHRTALTLKLTEQYLKPFIPEQLQEFLNPFYPEADKVLQQHPSNLKKWVEKTGTISHGLQQVAPTINQDIWGVISQAVINEQQCEVCYQSQRMDKPKKYVISPLGIVIRGPSTYLLAIYEGHDDIRQMAMHRFSFARVLPDDAVIPADFSVQNYIEEGHFGILYDEAPIELEIIVQPTVAKLLREFPLSSNQCIEKTDAGIKVRCTLPESWDLYRWLLSHGRDIKVESPQFIKQRYISYMQDAIDQYG